VLREALRTATDARVGNPRRDIVGRNLSFVRDVFRDPAEHPFLWAEDALSIPAPLYKRWVKRHGEERALELARTALVEPPLSVRAVPATPDACEALAAELAALEPRRAAHPAVLLFDGARTEDVVHSAAFAEGRATVQGETALAAAELVEARAGERVLELCAAPGGKTAVLAESGASVLATDLLDVRMARMAETLARLVPDAAVETLVSDGTAAVPPGTFDAVLVDAPCSNTGVLAKRPSARWRFGPRTRVSLAELQTRLLREAAERVRPGGRLVWSTCSLEPEENGQLVRAFVEASPDFTLELEHEALPCAGKPRADGPDGDGRPEGPVDGGYRARLRRRG
jgi:16S rRNA (cytosine967-C5)-methyltransferase